MGACSKDEARTTFNETDQRQRVSSVVVFSVYLDVCVVWYLWCGRTIGHFDICVESSVSLSSAVKWQLDNQRLVGNSRLMAETEDGWALLQKSQEKMERDVGKGCCSPESQSLPVVDFVAL